MPQTTQEKRTSSAPRSTPLQRMRQRCYQLMEGHLATSKAGRWINGVIIGLIVLNVIIVIIESLPGYHERYLHFFFYFELFSVVVFTFEYLIRLWSCVENPKYSRAPRGLRKGREVKGRIRYMLTPMALIDLIVIVPFYLALFISIDLRYLRLLRLLRLLKLTHYIRSLDIFIKVLKAEFASLASAIFAILVLVVVAACAVFAIEHSAQPEVFKTVLDAIWWAVVTLTTVGYGDITPITAGGKLLAMLIMLMGIATVALPAGMLAARFSEELQNRKSIITAEVVSALEDGRLNARERQILSQLSRQYGISETVLNQIIHNKQLELSHLIHCPHCGQSLFDPPKGGSNKTV